MGRAKRKEGDRERGKEGELGREGRQKSRRGMFVVVNPAQSSVPTPSCHRFVLSDGAVIHDLQFGEPLQCVHTVTPHPKPCMNKPGYEAQLMGLTTNIH